MSSTNQIQLLTFIERLNNVLSEGIRNSSLIFSPALYLGIGIRPKQITNDSVVWDFARSFYISKLLQRNQIGRQASMHAKDSVFDQSSNREIVKQIAELLPNFVTVSLSALCVKPVYSVNHRGLVVSSKKKEVLWELDFVSEEQTNSFYVLIASVNVVSQKKIILISRISNELENS